MREETGSTTNQPIHEKPFGVGGSSYKAAGEEVGIRQLVDDFYAVMADLSEAADILEMHPENLKESRDKLTRFLCGWLGGPKLYAQKYGGISIPGAHRHLKIGVAERDAWLACMAVAAEKQPYSDEFRVYLLRQLAVPANRVLQTSAHPDSAT